MRRTRNLVIVAVAAVLVSTACGSSHTGATKAPNTARPPQTRTSSSSTGSSTTSTAPEGTTTSNPPPPASTTTTGPAPSATTSPSSGTACASTRLAAALRTQQGAGGSGLYGFVVRNTGTTTCQLGGYFGVSVYNRVGHPLGVSDQREGHPRAIALKPGGQGSFLVQLGQVPVGHATSCPPIGAFHLIPPNTTTFDQVSLPADPGRHDCDPGVIVYPDRAGTAGLKIS
jgi:hypothetical protein